MPSSDLKGPKGKERSGTSRKGAGESGTAAGDLASSSSLGKKRGAKFCMCCGDCSHGTEDCKHPKASKISLVDGKLPRICFKCFETGHSKKFCPGEGKTKGASGGGSGRSSLKGATGAVRFCGAVPISDLCWAKERGVQEFLLDKEFGRGEVLQDFQKGKPGGVFPVIDRAEDLAKGKEKEESSPPVASEPSEVDISKMKVQKESDFRSDSSQESDYPFAVGELEVMGRLDSGSDYLMVDPEVWGEMEGEQVQVPIAYVRISGKIQVLYEAKLVIFRIEDGETNYLAYPMPTARLGIKALVPWELARELGAELRNIPKFFPGRALRSDDKKWIRGKEVFDEKKLEELQREKILLMIRGAMSENKKLPARTRCTLKGAKFKIEIKVGARLTNKPQYLICEQFWDQVKQRGKEWIDKGWVKLWPPGSTPEWHSPLLAVKKVSGNKWNRDICLCMDFRAPNSVTEDPTYLVPLLREMLSRLVGKKIFSELDLVDVYHQIALDEESMECTTFMIPGVGKAFWVVLFFGAKGAVAFFQKIIEGALGEILVDIVIVIYVDNILVALLEFEQHVREVETVIRALTKAGLRLKPSKCKIGFSSIQFMGAVLDGSKRGIDPHKVKVFALMRRLRTGKEVQKVLGYLNFLRDFIPLYANIVGPMEGLRSVKVISNDLWKESGGEGAFELAKKVLSEVPILHNLDWSLEFFLETDASQYGVGAILYQETEEGKRYVDFAAKAFNKAQQNYNAAKRELLAGLYAMNRWRPWLLFRKFTWGLDSKAVSFINTSMN